MNIFDLFSAVFTLGAFVIGLGFTLLMLVSSWKVFEKAGQPGWFALIPIFNLIVILQIAEKPIWWIILFFIPIVNIVASLMLHIAFANRFGHGAGFGIGLTLLPIVFWPILAFDSSRVR